MILDRKSEWEELVAEVMAQRLRPWLAEVDEVGKRLLDYR